MNDDPTFHIKYGDKSLECRRDNASLFMFLGDNASRNHVFVSLEDEDSPQLGIYVFDSHGEWMDTIAAYMINNGFPAHINLPEVPECDEDSYQRFINQTVEAEEIPDEIPDGWDV